MSSQKTFQSIIGKFSNGLEILKTISTYSPNKEVLKIAALETLKSNAEAKNSAVVGSSTTLKGLRNERRLISFNSKDSDTNCIENLFKNIASYIKAELGKDDPSYVKIASILKKLSPPNDKKEEPAEGEEPKKSISLSEKSYQSLVGFGNDVYAIIFNLGRKYSPANVNITEESLKAKIDRLAALNASIVKAENDYSTAVNERNEAYNGGAGINTVIPLIKDYLASFEGGKKNAGYAAFTNAVK